MSESQVKVGGGVEDLPVLWSYEQYNEASKLYGVYATIIIFVFLLYRIVYNANTNSSIVAVTQ